MSDTFHGRLVREDGGFVLRCDDGRRLHLILPRVPVDQVEKRVVVTGILSRFDTIEAEGVALGT